MLVGAGTSMSAKLQLNLVHLRRNLVAHEAFSLQKSYTSEAAVYKACSTVLTFSSKRLHRSIHKRQRLETVILKKSRVSCFARSADREDSHDKENVQVPETQYVADMSPDGNARLYSREDVQSVARFHRIRLPLGYEMEVANITVYKLVKWTILCALGIMALNALAAGINAIILNPSMWMYATWFFAAWPWPAAVVMGVFPIWRLIHAKRSGGRLALWEQLLTLCGALVWLILAPAGQFQGYVGLWPALLFSFYFVFFNVGAIVRLRLYGDLASKDQDEQWKTPSSRIAQIAFIVAIVTGHWLAAYEASMLQRSSLVFDAISASILTASLALHWQATFFLGKYFDRLVTPERVVLFGPYRFVRHPIYGSYMLLFLGLCCALRAPISGVLMLLASYLYYEVRTRLEENLLIKNFPAEYQEYRAKTPKKYFPFLF